MAELLGPYNPARASIIKFAKRHKTMDPLVTDHRKNSTTQELQRSIATWILRRSQVSARIPPKGKKMTFGNNLTKSRSDTTEFVWLLPLLPLLVVISWMNEIDARYVSHSPCFYSKGRSDGQSGDTIRRIKEQEK
mmetsp:Transcript_21377/g.43977  ORF Transcript_21377/g.43977 Transcript_21377/m.43977 type:complete len:135 (+) Transcript_21377:1406-1810(+)